MTPTQNARIAAAEVLERERDVIRASLKRIREALAAVDPRELAAAEAYWLGRTEIAMGRGASPIGCTIDGSIAILNEEIDSE